ncbi:MAG TPA: lamin tail domain-containing protein [Paludibacteraceae bacterium]|nr:lamin tail domain-containing protein [Paludibacteraceae bacterium]
MKRILFFINFSFPTLILAQFTENFLDGNLTENPQWVGIIDKFTIINGSLQLNDSSASGTANKAYLATASEAIENAEWQLSATVRTNLTSGNYIRFYMCSNNANFTENLQGYFVMVGGTAKEFALYRQDGTTNTKIIDGTDGRASSELPMHFQIKLTRNDNGFWQLFSKVGEEPDFVQEGEVTDKTHPQSSYSGIYIYYSSSNKYNFQIHSISATGDAYTLKIQQINRHDIVFSEIMADPDPVVGLPNAEYVELYNRTDSAIDLSGWTLGVGDKTAIIKDGNLPANGFLLLCSESNAPLFGVDCAQMASFPALVNSGQLLTLYDRQKNVVSWVNYSDKWYGNDAFKKDGGWSLERIDNDNLNVDEQNWTPSVAPLGGTPCAANSVAEKMDDYTPPKLLSTEYLSPKSLRLHFNKEMNYNSLQNSSNYTSDQIDIVKATAVEPKCDAVELTFDRDLTENEIVSINIDHLLCISNFPFTSTTRFAIPQQIEAQDIIINEILFNPVGDGEDYVEIYNRSNKTVNLAQLFLTRRKGDFLDTKIAVSDKAALFFPHSHLALTPSPTTVCAQFQCNDTCALWTTNLPSLPDDKGNIIVTLNDGTIIDEFSYSEKMHHVLLYNYEGVSLERINPDMVANNPKSWHSASLECGYGTPGRRNSHYQSLDIASEDKNFWVEREVFSPDNDGNDDLLFIYYRLPKSGFAATLTIYTPNGLKIGQPYTNALLATEGTLQWDGLSATKTMCQIGVYVIFVEAVHPDGDTVRRKIPCVLSTSK